MTRRVSAAKLKNIQRCELLNTAVIIGPVRVFDLHRISERRLKFLYRQYVQEIKSSNR